MSTKSHTPASPEHALAQVHSQMTQAVEVAVERVEKSVAHAKDRVEESFAHAKGRALAAKEQLEVSVESALESSKQSITETAEKTRSAWRRMGVALVRWFDTTADDLPVSIQEDRVDFVRTLPFIALHAACLFVFVVGFSWVALSVCIAMYLIRMFAITGFYHRYFSHKSFKTSRAFQFVMGIWGASSVQRGPLWWAANHRHHHKTSDEPEDFHSPVQHSFLWSHMGWIMGKSAFRTDEKQIPDLAKFPELKILDRFDLLVPVGLAVLMLLLGMGLEKYAPALGTNGWQMLVWGFFVSTVVLFHGTVTINSLSHMWGSRRYNTKDDSRNNWFLAVITLGEGWHNNHHHYPGAARQGFFWWEYDPTYYGLKVMSWLGLIWDLKPVPEPFKSAHKRQSA
jgi:stearoyl-CoA desaturase (Delta-9 desaturase)